MEDKLKALEELQEETIAKEKIVLAIYAAISGVSITCLLRMLTLDLNSWVVIAASSAFCVALVCFSLVVISIQHVLVKHKDLHIGHTETYKEFSKAPTIIGSIALAIGFLLVFIYISIFVFLVGIVGLYLASMHHGKFVKKLDSFRGARKALRD